MQTITIMAHSVVNPKASLIISTTDMITYKLKFIIGERPEQTSEVRDIPYIDYLFDTLYYHYKKRRTETEETFQARYNTLAEALFTYAQLQIFDNNLIYSSFTVSRKMKEV